MSKNGVKEHKDDFQFYILLRERLGVKVRSFTRPTPEMITLLPGEILVKTQDQPTDESLLNLARFEKRSLLISDCPDTEVKRLDFEEANLLLPFTAMSKRYEIYMEEGNNKLKFGKQLAVGNNVRVKINDRDEVHGVVKYKGELCDTFGTMFGVELKDCKSGKGSTDGLFKGNYYFRCNKDCGMYISLEKLSPYHINEKKGNSKSGSAKDKDFANKHEIRKKTENIVAECGHKLNDCVWVYIEDKLERGIVRFIGEHGSQSGIIAGVQMDNPYGEGNGEYHGKQLFTCDQNHAHFTRIENVISQENYKQMNYQSGNHDTPSNGFLGTDKHDKYLKSERHGNQSNSFLKRHGSLSNSGTTCVPFKVNDAVWVFMHNNGHPERGYVRFIGRIPGFTEMYAGIEMHSQCGRGNGDFHGKIFFECEKNHAYFTPIANVVPKEKLAEMYYSPAGYEKPDLKEKKVTSSDDIIKMESSFGKVSKEDFIQEQKEILQKAQRGKEQRQKERFPDDKRKETLLSPQSTSGVSEPYSPSRSDAIERCDHPNLANSWQQLDVDSMVVILSKSAEPKYGVIRWIGFTPHNNNKVAGLELEEDVDAGSDGAFLGKRYFTCPNKRGFFVHIHNCRPDTRHIQDRSIATYDSHLTGVDFGNNPSPIIEDDHLVLPPKNPKIYTKPGGPRGVQGHHNSCYLDSTLFASFAFSSVLDTVLLREKRNNDIAKYNEVRGVLRNKIVYPLRENGFVRADRVLELRRLLDDLGTVTGLVNEEKDPEEFILTLFQHVLKVEPFLKIKSGNDVHEEFFYQVFTDKDSERVLPSVEELLRKSFHDTNLKLAEVPSCLIVQMPRFGKGFKMYNRILPSLTINIGQLVDNAPQDCVVCGGLASFFCKDCLIFTPENSCPGNYCDECNGRVHSHTQRLKHESHPLNVSIEVQRHYANRPVEHQEMELFAVVCIETSHYVSFLRCNDVWCFFDSMADRVGSKDGYNVPAVTECPELVEWLSSEKRNRNRIIETNNKEMPEKVRRILNDAYMCFYQSKEMAMYR